MLASDYARANAKKKGVGLHYSGFQKPAVTLPTTYETKAPKNRHFRSRIAEVGVASLGDDRAAFALLNALLQAKARSRIDPMPATEFLTSFLHGLGLPPVIPFSDVPGIDLDHHGEGFGWLIQTHGGLGGLGLWRHEHRLAGLFLA
jgi:hypothetical protein